MRGTCHRKAGGAVPLLVSIAVAGGDGDLIGEGGDDDQQAAADDASS